MRNDEITPKQFVDLNEKLGGMDVDWVIIPNETDADPGAIGLAYRAGLVNDFSQLDKLAIIDLRGTRGSDRYTSPKPPRQIFFPTRSLSAPVSLAALELTDQGNNVVGFILERSDDSSQSPLR